MAKRLKGIDFNKEWTQGSYSPFTKIGTKLTFSMENYTEIESISQLHGIFAKY